MLPMNEEAPLVPVVVKLIAFCLLLNVVQSVELKYPFVVALDCEILIVGVVPPELEIGPVAPTDVTAPMTVLKSDMVIFFVSLALLSQMGKRSALSTPAAKSCVSCAMVKLAIFVFKLLPNEFVVV